MRTPPVIGVTLSWYPNVPAKRGSYGEWMFGLNQTYADLAGSSGCFAAGLLPCAADYSTILDTCGIIILTGGGDPDPALYSQELNGSLNVSRKRPEWEIGLYRAARERSIPVLGICLGMQLISIAENIPLIQDIPSQYPDPIDHYGRPDDPRKHPVRLLPGTFLEEVLGGTAQVSSFHHQGIVQVPDGFSLAAESSDGLIEAIESDDGLVVAVQWHPERDTTGVPILRAMLHRIQGYEP